MQFFEPRSLQAWRCGFIAFSVNGFLFYTYAAAEDFFLRRPPLGNAVLSGFHWRRGWQSILLRYQNFPPVAGSASIKGR